MSNLQGNIYLRDPPGTLALREMGSLVRAFLPDIDAETTDRVSSEPDIDAETTDRVSSKPDIDAETTDRVSSKSDIDAETTDRVSSKSDIGAKTTILSYGYLRYYYKTVDELCRLGSEEKWTNQKLKESLRIQLDRWKDGEVEENHEMIKACLDTILAVSGSYDRLELLRDVFNEFTEKELKLIPSKKDTHEKIVQKRSQSTYEQDIEYVKNQGIQFDAKKEELLEKYRDKYVLFEDGKVLDYASSKKELVERAYRKHGMKVLFIELVSVEKQPSGMVLTPF